MEVKEGGEETRSHEEAQDWLENILACDSDSLMPLGASVPAPPAAKAAAAAAGALRKQVPREKKPKRLVLRLRALSKESEDAVVGGGLSARLDLQVPQSKLLEKVFKRLQDKWKTLRLPDRAIELVAYDQQTTLRRTWSSESVGSTTIAHVLQASPASLRAETGASAPVLQMYYNFPALASSAEVEAPAMTPSPVELRKQQPFSGAGDATMNLGENTCMALLHGEETRERFRSIRANVGAVMAERDGTSAAKQLAEKVAQQQRLGRRKGKGKRTPTRKDAAAGSVARDAPQKGPGGGPRAASPLQTPTASRDGAKGLWEAVRHRVEKRKGAAVDANRTPKRMTHAKSPRRPRAKARRRIRPTFVCALPAEHIERALQQPQAAQAQAPFAAGAPAVPVAAPFAAGTAAGHYFLGAPLGSTLLVTRLSEAREKRLLGAPGRAGGARGGAARRPAEAKAKV